MTDMILAAALMRGLGMHYGAWAARDGAAGDYVDPALYLDLARTAEAGKLHAVFLAEQITVRESGLHRPSGALDTATVLALMACVTSKVGLVGTGSTTYNQPYDLARRFLTLDHLSRGRAGWNSVTTVNADTAAMFGDAAHLEHADRYARADEFIDVVTALWESWEPDALVGDRERGVFAREDGVHEINHVGPHFSVKGPLPLPRSRQGRPVIFQAGSSGAGRDQAARVADVVFTAQHTLDDAVEFRTDLRARAAAYGRDPDSVKVLPGIALILGATAAEAAQRKRRLDEAAGIGLNLGQLAGRVGLPVEALELDKPFPVELLVPDAEFRGSVGFRRSLVNLALKESLTVRELLEKTSGSVHHQVVGTAETIADAMRERLDAGAADGFVLMVDMLPSGLHDIVSLLVPELQRRGLFHTDYSHDTLRDNLGLAAVPALARAA